MSIAIKFWRITMIIFALAAFFIHSSHAKTLSSTVVYTLSWINCTACRIETHVAFLRILKIEKTITCSDSCFRKKKNRSFSESVLCKICLHRMRAVKNNRVQPRPLFAWNFKLTTAFFKIRITPFLSWNTICNTFFLNTWHITNAKFCHLLIYIQLL